MTEELHTALQWLQSRPGLEIRVAEQVRLNHRVGDALVSITSGSGFSKYIAEHKRGVTTTTLPRVIAQLETMGRDANLPPLLLAPHLTPGVTKRLVEEHIDFADAAGNVFIDGPAAYILVLGQKPRTVQTDSGFTATDLQLIFALLARPELRDATYRELHSLTGVSLGKISSTVNQLESLGHLSRPPSGGLLFRDPQLLLERWEFGYLEQLRPSLRPTGWRVGPSSQLSILRERAVSLDGVLIGGEHAADAITRHLTPATLTLHVPEGKDKFIASELQLVRGGSAADVVTLERFIPSTNHEADGDVDAHPKPSQRGLAHPILVRAELLALDDPRLRNVADRLLTESILPGLRHDLA